MKNRIIYFTIVCSVVFALSGCENENVTIETPTQTEAPVVTETAQETPIPTIEASISTAEPVKTSLSLDSMTKNERTELNTFLSNFSEASYMLHAQNINEEKISFAHLHNMINNGDKDIIIEDSYFKMPASLVDKILVRFFGSSVPHETPANATEWEYEDGYFKMIAADGDTHAYFSIATSISDNGNDTYTVNFNVYFNQNEPTDWIPKEFYTYDDECANTNYEYMYSGSAVIKPVTINNSETYQLISYNV